MSKFDERIDELMMEATGKKTEKKTKTQTKKTLSKAKVKPGKMHKLLKVPADKNITDVYKSPKKLVDDLMKATKDDYKKVKGMIAFAANMDKTKNIFDNALKLVVKKD